MEEEGYFRMIEEYFLQKRGNPVLLSPREWSLIREWYDSNIPQEIVLRGIDRAFEALQKKEEPDREALSLRYCRRLVKSEHKRYLKSLEGKTPFARENPPEAKDVGAYLQQLGDSLEESSKQIRQNGNDALADLLMRYHERLAKEVLEPFLENTSSDLQRVEQQLTTLEKEIEQLLLQLISPEQMKLLKEEAMRDLKTFEGKLDFGVYQEMVRRSLIKSLRRVYGIPRLSLFYM